MTVGNHQTSGAEKQPLAKRRQRGWAWLQAATLEQMDKALMTGELDELLGIDSLLDQRRNQP